MPDWMEAPLKQLIDALLSEYGPIFVVLIAGIVLLFLKYDKTKNQIIQAKDAEIERLVEERNRYQSMLLGSVSVLRMSALRRG